MNGAEDRMEDKKICAGCGQEKPLSAYTKRSGSSSRRGTCRVCLRRRQREHQTAPMESEHTNEAVEVGEAPPETKPKRKRKRRRRKPGPSDVHTGTQKPSSTTSMAVRPPEKLITPLKGPFKYRTSILNDRGKGRIRLRGYVILASTGLQIFRPRWSRMVKEGAAGIIGPGLIHKLYTKTDFRLLILQRDHYVCHYCGRYGDTIDHVLPKSKGGLSTPANCVCACADCNLKKADHLEFVYDDFM